MLTLDEVAQELGCGLNTVHQLILLDKLDVRQGDDGVLKILRGDVRHLKEELLGRGLFQLSSKIGKAKPASPEDLQRIKTLAKKNGKRNVVAGLSKRWRRFVIVRSFHKEKKSASGGRKP